ncbi:hypothetical protein WS71_29825 [Burkholderia mayonis]|uniref:Uncharacterized protein n=2 Tax=Burkholderia mayonis TaxID=1385591 RepID=A0A1B4G5U3_9BURK|nr:hypothetical protein WS71_29825 [Burkholderia mayonis]KVE46262.1 hypothetical protein WS71_20995 [Burkholderia mayonis]
MQAYLDVRDHISKQKKKDWQIAELGRNGEEVFRVGDKVVHCAVHDRLTDELIVCFYHALVTKSLQEQGKKLGNYLHSLKYHHPPDDS